MKKQPKLLVMALFAMATQISPLHGAALVLDNSPGDGTVSITVDGFGSFGSNLGPYADPYIATFQEPGNPTPFSTTYESALGLQVTSGGGSPGVFLTSGQLGSGGPGAMASPTLSGNSTTVNSSFTVNGLSFSLQQTLVPLFSGVNQVGTVLEQSYSILNISGGAISFNLTRYMDADIPAANFLNNGAGRVVGANGREALVTTVGATGNAPTTFAAISAEGGTIPVAGRYQVFEYTDPNVAYQFGTLNNTVANDSVDADQFADTGADYAMALMNQFSLSDGESTVYVTRTVFGTGSPTDLATVPEASTVIAGSVMLALMGLAVWRRRVAAAPASR